MVHRDIRADNILLNEKLCAKVADFGLARFGANLYQDISQFPFQWTAPEAMETLAFTWASDVWAFGVLLWEIVTLGKTPYKKMEENGENVYMKYEELLNVLKNGVRLLNPEIEGLASWCPRPLYQLMLDCWNADPKERPTFRRIRERLQELSRVLRLRL